MAKRLGNLEKRIVTGRAEATVTGARFVKQGAAVNGVTPCSVLGEKALGVAKFGAASGDVVSYVAEGETLVEASAAIALGADVGTDATGKAITSATGKTILGQALEAAAAGGDLILVRLNLQNRAVAA